MKSNQLIWMGMAAAICFGCMPKKNEYSSYEQYPVREDNLTEMQYDRQNTTFTLWAPTADEVKVSLYDTGERGAAYETIPMARDKDGTWTALVGADLLGKFYTFNVRIGEKWLGETPGINAHAVGVNGKRAAIIDMQLTNPEGWEQDRRPPLASWADAVIYEMHHRDFSIHPSSGIKHKGKFLALTEEGTLSPDKLATGIDHLKELGVTHVHLLPSYDFASIDETRLDDNRYNWGYDPQNYNVPEGSYATDPYNPVVRIREFKQMVQALHKAGIRVVLDVVYNHTFNTADSNFERTVPGYFYRQMPDGSFADGSACGNETASNRPMMRKYMIESVRYWLTEYHLDGFRFDLMGIHDIETMNRIREAATAIDPSILIYGEGWAAREPQYPLDSLAMKANIYRMPGIAAFSDELRDGLRGPFNDDAKGAFLAGVPGEEESIKFGMVGAINHPDINGNLVNYSKTPWAEQPTQMISYVSCHDDMCLVDRLHSTLSYDAPQVVAALDKLAQTVVFTSQGIPFMYAGEEVMRDKKGVHNSYVSPDSINAIDWTRKAEHADVFAYYKALIRLRRHHQAFRMGDAGQVRQHLSFLPVTGGNLIAFRLAAHAGGDEWEDIIVAFNSRNESASVTIPEGEYTVVCRDGVIDERGLGTVSGKTVDVPGRSAVILYK
ncbi:MAG: type I pullulanase [Prevotellaceae bacterium]|jgi:pullulanase|nr:type I pullulanase [Prevotellaceae bacterium]